MPTCQFIIRNNIDLANDSNSENVIIIKKKLISSSLVPTKTVATDKILVQQFASFIYENDH